MGTNERAGISRRTAIKAAAWSVPVIAASSAVPLAAASLGAAELTAWFVTTCGGRDRYTLFITNHTSEPLQTFVDVDLDGDGIYDAGDGPVVDPGTSSYGYGLASNGTPTYRVSTAREVYLIEQLDINCPPTGLASQVMVGAIGETSTPVTLTLRNETASTMQVYVDLDFNDDQVIDSTETPVLAPFEERSIVYDVTASHIGIDVRNDIGYTETSRVSWSN